MYSRVWISAAIILAVATVSFGLGEATRSALLTPNAAFEQAGTGEWQGTQVLNKATGRVESLFGMAVGPFSGSPAEAARRYLSTQTAVTGYAAEELSLVRSIESQGSRFVTFEAKVGGLPVYPGETVVTFDSRMRVVFLYNGLLPVDRTAKTGMGISADAAIQIARSYLKPSGRDQGAPSARAVLWTGDTTVRPAWIVSMPAEQPRGDWQIFVDGNSGQVFRVRNNEKDFNGHGMAFVPDPLTTAQATYGQTGYTDNSDANSTQLQAQRVAVTLPDITFSGGVYSLSGPWVNLLNFESPAGNPVTSTDSNGFSFTRDAQGFEDVMCYYHIDLSQRWIQSLGFSNIQHAPIGCDPHGLSGADNSHYVPSTNRIAFGEGGVDDAEDADVIWHEYGHGIQNSQVPNYGAGGDEGAMGEGFGDYWAGSYSQSISSFNNSWIFNWDGHNTFWAGRTFTQNKVYPTNLDGEVHDDGEIWSQACYDTRNRANVGRTVMDKVVLQHHFSLGTTATMPTAAAAILTADNSLYGGVHYPDIYAGFVPRGLLSSTGAISCLAPNGGESWNTGTTHTISWSYYNLTGNARIEINRSYPAGAWELVNNTTALSTGSYTWTVSGAATATARIRISADNNTAVNDISNANFTIVSSGPQITLTAPNGGESWYVGDANTITWTSSGLAENVKIELNRAYPGATWETIVASTANTGSYSWTLTGAASTTARVRVSGVTQTTVADTSNANFTIGVRVIVLTAPNGGETWLTGDANAITWTASGLLEDVRIELNRTYPGATWETIVASTNNTGVYVWTVTAPLTGTARIRIYHVTHTSIADTSAANFTIAARALTVTSPNGSESWTTGSLHNITWTSQSLTGTVSLDLNRSYPAGAWENIATGALNNGSYPWTVTGPVTSVARVRLTSESFATVSDVSDANFSIFAPNQPPVIVHDPLHDQNPAPFTVTTLVTDDAPGVSASISYRLVGAPSFNTLAMPSTGNANEFAATIPSLVEGSYEYYLSATDAGLLTSTTAHYVFYVAQSCGNELGYDDGNAERSNWSSNTAFKWAVKFDAPALPFALCNVRVGISAANPDAAHSQVQVSILHADGPGGLPGTPVVTRVAGSIGNVIGGVPQNPDNWTTVFFRDNGQPFVLSGAFYVAVSNPDSAAGFESFLSDTTGALAGRSYVYSPCDSSWHLENVTDSITFRGNRMIRVSGYGLIPPGDVVILPVGNDLHLDWTNVGAPFYHIYSALYEDGPFTTLVGTTTTNSFIDAGAADARKFYRVLTSTTP
ncbi:MAG TPA: M36 family metallopeptidase [bacterium]